jgi:hypothetical protein
VLCIDNATARQQGRNDKVEPVTHL